MFSVLQIFKRSIEKRIFLLFFMISEASFWCQFVIWAMLIKKSIPESHDSSNTNIFLQLRKKTVT